MPDGCGDQPDAYNVEEVEDIEEAEEVEVVDVEQRNRSTLERYFEPSKVRATSNKPETLGNPQPSKALLKAESSSTTADLSESVKFADCKGYFKENPDFVAGTSNKSVCLLCHEKLKCKYTEDKQQEQKAKGKRA
jgi:hypothetical protein